ncbi:hypothetical protein MMC15_005860 [Xylographa vitiligo]|nr:hypothetical protein [Xylographa vitiligo]
MAGDGSNYRLPSWDEDLRPQDRFIPLELQGGDSSLQATDENMLMDSSTPPLNLLHSDNNLQTSGGETSNDTTHGLLPELWHTPEELQCIADICGDPPSDVRNNDFASTPDSAHSSHDLQAFGGESSTSMTPHTLLPELNLSPEEFQYNNELPSAFNSRLSHDTSVTSSDFLHNVSDLAFMDSSDFYHSGSNPHTCKSLTAYLCDPPGQLQSCDAVSLDVDNSLPPEAFISPLNVSQYENDLQASKGESSTPNLYALHKELEGYSSVLPLFDHSFQPEAFVFPFDSFHCENDLQTSRGESSTSMLLIHYPPTYLFPLRNSNVMAVIHRFSTVAFGPMISNLVEISYRATSAFEALEMKIPLLLSPIKIKLFLMRRRPPILKPQYSGHNLQIQSDKTCSPDHFYQDQTLPRQANDFHTNPLDSGNVWQTMNDMASVPTPVPQVHLFGHALNCIFSGNNFQSLIRVARSWASASFLVQVLKMQSLPVCPHF